MLKIANLTTEISQKNILNNLSLNLPKGEIHVVMGPNGVGKSTLGHVLMANHNYQIKSGKIYLNNVDISDLTTTERAKLGLFLAFQYPVVIPGLKISEYLRNLYAIHHNGNVGVSEFRKIVKQKMDMLNIDKSVLSRYLNEGFSGGETKRLEMLQLALVEPKVAILDEIDSGVDIDGQKIIANAINTIAQTVGTSFLIITHYQRMLSFLNPQKVHILIDGKIMHSGDMTLVTDLEREGYDWMRKQNNEKYGD